jgi:hypothetical protein
LNRNAYLYAIFQVALTPNKYPINAVIPMAAVPQNTTRITPLLMLEPPALAATTPRKIRKNNALK